MKARADMSNSDGGHINWDEHVRSGSKLAER